MRSLRGASDGSALELLEGSLLLDAGSVLDEVFVELFEASGLALADGVLVDVDPVDGLVDEFGVALVEDGIAFGSVCETVAAPLPGEAVASLLAADCECETPTAAVSAAANATELQVRDFFMNNSRWLIGVIGWA